MRQDYWFVTRPKRKLNTIPEILAAFCTVALNKKWSGNRQAHRDFEDELEHSETKRVGERRDGSGSGGRTYASMLFSLGLWFEKYEKVYLTLAGEAIMNGDEPYEILKKQVLLFQYPSAYSDTRYGVTPRFKVRPFLFLLKLLSDSRLENILSQDEIAFVVLISADKESDYCYEKVVSRILEYRNSQSWRTFGSNYLADHRATETNLRDVANTMMNWLDYTRLVYRTRSMIGINEEKKSEVADILNNIPHFIKYTGVSDDYQRRYGIDPKHQKDTRNLLRTQTITARSVEKSRIIKMFFELSSVEPVKAISHNVVSYISGRAGTDYAFTEEVLLKAYPHGALNGFMVNYREMAFKGTDQATNFEKATTKLFDTVLGYKTQHLGQGGSKSVPDVLLISDSEGYQAIIDNKAYSNYSISGDHHNRMVHNYLAKISQYSTCSYSVGFFTYISGGFKNTIDEQIRSIADEAEVHGSGITVDNLIHLLNRHVRQPYTHRELKDIFSLDRRILLRDL